MIWLLTLLLWLPGSMPLLPNDIEQTLKSTTPSILQKGREVKPGPQLEYTVGPGQLCSRIAGLSPGQKKLCQLYQDHMKSVVRGASLAVSECKFQFRYRRWNCSSVNKTNIFRSPVKIGSRESAFTSALLSAAVSHSISLGCRDGQLSSCSCSRGGRPKDLPKEWLWGGCGDDLEYGYKFTKEFLDVREREKRGKKKSRNREKKIMNLHNNEVGRLAVIKKSRVTCKCHGVSGSCSLITCWHQLPTFREVGDLLQAKYEGAVEVKVNKREKLEIKNAQYVAHTPADLVYLDESPNYCVANLTLGIEGTQGRSCNRTSLEMDSCNILCCGRGYNTQKITIKERCQCKFHWCCNVECKTCINTIDLHTCK